MKSIEREFEARSMLNEFEYQMLFDSLTNEYKTYDLIEQENIYLDTPDLKIIKDKNVLRIRVINSQKILTLKTSDDKGITEYSSLVDYPNELIGEGVVKDKLIELGYDVNQIEVKGSLKTKRLEIKDEFFTIALDKNEYFDIVDYNFEIESSSLDNANKVMNVFAKQFDFEVSKNYVVKSKRFMDRMKK